MLIKRRVRRLAILLISLYLLPVAQLWYYQILTADRLTERPENSRSHEELSLRGSLLDRKGQVLAKTKTDHRVYPLGEATGPLIGYVTGRLGSGGLEGELARALAGRPRPRTLEQVRRLQREGSRRGDDLVLTLDSDLQKECYRLLGQDRGAIVVLDLETGDILAVASRPSFDPATLEKHWKEVSTDKSAPLIDRATQGLYPPGSSFKILTMAAALEDGKTRTDEMFVCKGSLYVDGFTLYDDSSGHGPVDLVDALAYSCNPTFATLGGRLGLPRLKEWMKEFGLLERPVRVPLAAPGRAPEGGPGSEQVAAAQAGYGQADMLLSPLGMARVAAVIGRRGSDLPPRLLKAVSRDGKTVDTFPVGPGRQVVSPATADAVLAAMRQVVVSGTGRGAALDGVEVAGKTGTAENPHGPPHAWFVGVTDRLAVAVILENKGYGGQHAAPLAREALRAALGKLP